MLDLEVFYDSETVVNFVTILNTSYNILYCTGKDIKYTISSNKSQRFSNITNHSNPAIINNFHLTFSLPYMTEISVVIRQ